LCFCFFFQAEDGIRAPLVTGVQTCALPISRLARPFGVRHFLATVVLIGAALFPSLADWHRVRLGLAPEQFAVLQSYCYLALKVAVGILVGATLSWILLTRYVSQPSRRPQYQRK